MSAFSVSGINSHSELWFSGSGWGLDFSVRYYSIIRYSRAKRTCGASWEPLFSSYITRGGPFNDISGNTRKNVLSTSSSAPSKAYGIKGDKTKNHSSHLQY